MSLANYRMTKTKSIKIGMTVKPIKLTLILCQSNNSMSLVTQSKWAFMSCQVNKNDRNMEKIIRFLNRKLKNKFDRWMANAIKTMDIKYLSVF